MWAVKLGAALRATTSQAAPAAVVSPWLVDEFVESYVRWRDECASVRAAYEHWRGAERHDGALAHAAYREALDREELAAQAYQDCHARFARQPA
jgi:hypothetical protein